MKRLKIKILIGIPASGKTTWSKHFLHKLDNQNWVRVCRDDYRYMLRDENFCSPKIEAMITDMVKRDTFTALSRKLNVILDATHVKLSYINDIINTFKYYADIDYQVFDISLEKALERDENRVEKVGKDVIKRMYNNYKILIDSFDFQPVKKVDAPFIEPNFKSSLKNAVIFDIDGTLALMGNRSPYEWEKVDRDRPNYIVSELLDFHKSKGRTIILLSGRDEAARETTIEWAKFYGIHYDELFMRPENDNRNDAIIKRELYEEHIKPYYNVLCVFDDRLRILDMWYKEGIFTFNVNQGNIPY